VRWNAIIDTGGTPPRLQSKARKPREIVALIEQVADENNCDVEVYWDRFSWFAYVTVQGRSEDLHQANAEARNVLALLEAVEARQELDLDEKEEHPNAMGASAPEG
jgi:hypothetical protein